MSKNNEHDGHIQFGPLQIPWEQQIPYGAKVKSPKDDPIETYVSVPPESLKDDFPGIDYKLFELPPNAMTDNQRKEAVNQLKKVIKTQHANFLGFQANQDEKYGDYSWLLDMHVNNIGDPFTGGLFNLNSKFCERAVLDYFAALWNVDWPHIENKKKANSSYWGYVLSMGFTEGNIYGLYNARDYLKGRMLIQMDAEPGETKTLIKRGKAAPVKKTEYLYPFPEEEDSPEEKKEPAKVKIKNTPILFFSEDAHYSIIKAARVLGIKTFHEEGTEKYKNQCPALYDEKELADLNDGAWPEAVPSHNFDNNNPSSGQVDVKKLKKLVNFFIEQGYPVIIVLNVGSTWKGAYDNVPAVNRMLEELGEDYPGLWEHEFKYKDSKGKCFTDIRRRFWVHIDGALGASYLPFLEMAYNQKKIEKKPIKFDFRNEVVMSIGCSLHKWPGLPVPSGIYMTRTKYQLEPPAKVGYIGSPDTTLGGSRSGLAPILTWDYFSRMSYTDNMMKALECENVSKYFQKKMEQLEAELQEKYPKEKIDLWIARSKMALTVRFRMVNPKLTYKYSIDNERLVVPVVEKKTIGSQERSYSHVFFMHSAGHVKADELIMDIKEACKNNWHDAFPEYDGDKPNPGEIKEIE